jgi:cell volume regulation protein A
LMQITMFLTLGLLVFPSRLVPILGPGFLIAAILLLVARPVSVFVCLLPFRLELRQKLFVAWVGLRGAVPIVLATYPLLARLPKADLVFNIVFFVVLTSVLLQGTSIPFVARHLKVDAPLVPKRTYPIEYVPNKGFKNELKELLIPAGSPVVGKAIVELGLPAEFLIILIARENDFILPSGGTVLQAGDTLLVLSEKEAWEQGRAKVAAPERT